MKKIDTSAFHEYDIRGIYPTEIDENFYYHLGKALAHYIGKGPISVGHDARNSSPSLAKSLIDGLVDHGIDVVFLGQISTEMNYYAMGKYNFEASVMISASHNPGKYNGAKIIKKGVIPLHGSFGLPELKEYINHGMQFAPKKGEITEKNIFDEWIQYALSKVDVSKMKPLKVVIDAGNGIAGPTWEAVAKFLPIKMIPLYLEPNGDFPNHDANPLDFSTLKDIVATIKKENADLGIALDGDADRAFFIDEKGEIITGTVATAIFCDYFARNTKGNYLYSATCGRIVEQTIEGHGSTPIRTNVGHSKIKEAMRMHDGVFAGEHSGHFYFKDNFYAESSLLAGLLMIQLLSEEEDKMSTIRQEFDIYPQSGEINFKVENSQEMIDSLIQSYKHKVNKMDDFEGHSFWSHDWWFNIRFSKTEPLMRLNIEANTKEILDEKMKDIIEFIEKSGGVRK